MAEDEDLRARVARLEAEVAALHARLAALEHPSLLPGGGEVARRADEGVREAPGVPQVPLTPAAPDLSPTGERGRVPRDWERLIAGRWALWLGALAIFLAVAFFLASAWQALGPLARLAGGF